MTVDHFSLAFVNAATGLMLGLSLYPTVDVWPWLRERWHWWLIIAMIVAWAGMILIGSLFDHPTDLIVRRFTNGAAALYVAAVLALQERNERRREAV